MMKINRIGFSALALISVLFASCGDEESALSPAIEEQNAPIAAGSVSASALTAKVSGTFNGFSKVDLALAKKGVLYCVKSDNAEAIFKSWLDGNDNPDCYVFQNGDLEGTTYKANLMNLTPDTEYSFCIFLKKKDNSREISSVYTFNTEEFKPEFKNARVDSVRYFYAVAKGGVTIDSRDAGQCNAGMMVSTSQDGALGDSTCVFSDKSNNQKNMRIEVYMNIYPERQYYLKTFVSYKTADGQEHVVYGAATPFTTGSLDEYGVDLGLPSGIKWSRVELGRQEFESSFDYMRTGAYWVRWGEVTYKEDYVHWDAATQSYIDIGDDISGTEYDVAHLVLGGKWRMPTKADFEELIANCTIGTPHQATYYYRYESGSATFTTNVAEITGPNGNVIKSRNSSCWTATLSEDGIHPYVARYSYDRTTGVATILLTHDDPREYDHMIRPVWDPEM